MFLVYRLVVANAGLEQLGVWSLLLAGSALARSGDVSGAGALGRFVAMRSRSGETVSARDTVHTVILTSLAFNVLLGVVLWFAAPFALPFLMAPHLVAAASELIPFVIGITVLGAIAVAVTSAIDGAQRSDQRALVMSVAASTFLGASWLLVPRFGIIGFGAAQLTQQVTALVFGWLVLRRHVADLGWVPCHWRRDVFAETTAYALKLNAIGVAALLFEPLAKFAFNHAGGPALVALYELASRLVVQVRSLVIAAAIPLMPAFAAQTGANDPAFRPMLLKATRVAAGASVGVTVVTLLGAPLMSVAILDRLSPELLTMNSALAAGWSLNILCLVFYMAAEARGVLNWNFAGHVVIAISVIIGVVLLVPMFGPPGLIAAIIFGLVLSTLTVLLGNGLALEAADVVGELRWCLVGASVAIVLMCGLVGLVASVMAPS